MSGTAVAASLITSKQIKDGTIQTKDLSKKAVKSLRGKRGPAGLGGAAGAAGTAGAKGDKGDKGDTGDVGPAGPFPTTLPAGKTISGVFDMEGTAAAANGLVTGDISFLYPMSHSFTAIYVNHGTTDPTCTGSYADPTAPSGKLCVYENGAGNASGNRGINFTSSKSGVGLYLFSAAAGQFSASGSWAATG